MQSGPTSVWFLEFVCRAAGAAARNDAARSLLASAPASSVVPANSSLPDLTATQAIALLCAREITSVQYVQALFERYDSGGFECLNAFISLNRTQVTNCFQVTYILTLLSCRLQCKRDRLQSPVCERRGPFHRLRDLHATSTPRSIASHAVMTKSACLLCCCADPPVCMQHKAFLISRPQVPLHCLCRC